MWDHVSHPHKTTGYIRLVKILIFAVLASRREDSSELSGSKLNLVITSELQITGFL